MKFEIWRDHDLCGFSLVCREGAPGETRSYWESKEQREQEGFLVAEFYAASWDQACALRNEIMGWEPYVGYDEETGVQNVEATDADPLSEREKALERILVLAVEWCEAVERSADANASPVYATAMHEAVLAADLPIRTAEEQRRSDDKPLRMLETARALATGRARTTYAVYDDPDNQRYVLFPTHCRWIHDTMGEARDLVMAFQADSFGEAEARAIAFIGKDKADRINRVLDEDRQEESAA